MKWTTCMAVAAGLLAGCATHVPQPIRQAPPGSPTEEAVRARPQAFVGARVRWGGTIAGVENREGETVVEMVSRDLDSRGRPIESDRSTGRFLARYAGFLDPMIYTQGRLLTVVGTVDGEERRPIGRFSYNFPAVKVESHHLWEPIPEVMHEPYSYHPFWYDPWWPRLHHPWRRYPFF